MNWPNIVSLAAFQLVWLACALGAASGSNLPGIAASGSYLLILVLMGRLDQGDIKTSLLAGLCGLLSESALMASGLISYRAAWPSEGMAPPWIVALWVAFGATISPTLQMLGNSALAKGAGLGLVFGPLAYIAGERLGALSLLNPPHRSLAAVAILWATIFPGLLYFRAIQARH